jgi:dTDP-4-amino-4,6-dideoxygalactose transaminase
MFYLLCNSMVERDELIAYCKRNGVQLVFHYSSLHKSDYFYAKHDGRNLPNSDFYSEVLVRLPLYPDLSNREVSVICNTIKQFFLDRS